MVYLYVVCHFSVALLQLLEDASAPSGEDGLSIPDKGWCVVWKAPSGETGQESPPEGEETTPSEEECTQL